nr:MAG: ORF1 [Torque teno midi virus]
MPFWWKRRRTWWSNNYRRKRRTYRPRYKRRRRPLYRYKRRRPTRRRRRRRYKVRRKKASLTVRQWQPDKIVKCKVKGTSVLVLGADGTQSKCYTNEAEKWTPARTPGGGGFGAEKYTMQYLYEEQKFHRNIWTKSNLLLDLVRYFGCKFVMYRHPETDFIVNYDRNLPMNIDKFTYMSCHPSNMLLARHKKIIPSKLTRPNGKNRITIKIKPSKVVLNKWFFQENFARTGLCLIKATAANLNYAHMGSAAQNKIVSLFSLNTSMYANASWGQAATSWKPYSGFPANLTYTTAAQRDKVEWKVPTTYDQQISYETGFFNYKWMQMTSIDSPHQQLAKPIIAFRYNPDIDDGKGTSVWFKSTLKNTYEKPKSDLDLIIEGYPLWMAVYGFYDFVQSTKPDENFLDSYILVFECKYVKPYTSHATHYYWVPIDTTFIQGKAPYGAPLFEAEKKKWFPTLKNQQESINAFVKSGPFIPRYGFDKRSTWELHAFYTFFFKFGGTFTNEDTLADPSKQGTYITPTLLKERIQIYNPEKQKAAAMLHGWDYRRGMLTSSAIKRMCTDAETDTDFQTDISEPKKKKQRTGKTLTYPPQEKKDLQTCLLSLFEEPTSSEHQEEKTTQELIQEQKAQQQQLRYNILKVISDIKQQQQLLQLHTGLIN